MLKCRIITTETAETSTVAVHFGVVNDVGLNRERCGEDYYDDAHDALMCFRLIKYSLCQRKVRPLFTLVKGDATLWPLLPDAVW